MVGSAVMLINVPGSSYLKLLVHLFFIKFQKDNISEKVSLISVSPAKKGKMK